jgi:hypothetical protein
LPLLSKRSLTLFFLSFSSFLPFQLLRTKGINGNGNGNAAAKANASSGAGGGGGGGEAKDTANAGVDVDVDVDVNVINVPRVHLAAPRSSSGDVITYSLPVIEKGPALIVDEVALKRVRDEAAKKAVRSATIALMKAQQRFTAFMI